MGVAKLSVLRLLVVVFLALCAGIQIVRSAVVSTFVSTKPDVAARVWPKHPLVSLAMAMSDIGKAAAAGQGASTESVEGAMAAARRGPLLIDPLLIKGAATLSQGQQDVAERLFREARRRDPRSAAARYFLAEYYLRAGRPVEGLAEASVLTRLVNGGSTALIPGLVQYARAPGAVTNLRKIFETNPTLGNQVMAELARDASNADLLIDLAGKDFDLNSAEVPPWQSQLIRSLLERGNYAKARALWLKISGLRQVPGLFNPEFAITSAPAPFNWTFGSGNFGVAEPAASGKLQVIYYGRDDGQFASQLLLLPPGSYELRMQIKRDGASEKASGLTWTLSCQPGAKRLLSLALANADSRTGALVGLFTVSADCPSQKLVLNGISREFAGSEQVMISNLQLVGGLR